MASRQDEPPKETGLARNCLKCGKLWAPWMGVCYHCGHDYRPKSFLQQMGCVSVLSLLTIVIVAIVS